MDEQCPIQDTHYGHTDEQSDDICERCGQSGHSDLMCRVRLDHSKRILNDFIPTNRRKGRVPRVSTLVGSANETHVLIEGVRTQALLDTGSSVSTISQSFYETHLSHLPLQPVKTLMSLECADGSALPYLGFIACELQVHGISDKPEALDSLFLVVNNTSYHKTVPVLIGIYVLIRLAQTNIKYL